MFYYRHQTLSQCTASVLLRAKRALLPEITEIFNTQNLFFSLSSPAFHSLFCAIFRNPQVYTLQHVKYAFIVFTALLYTAPGCDKLPRAAAYTYTLQQYITSFSTSLRCHPSSGRGSHGPRLWENSLSGSGREQSPGLKINHANLTEEKSELYKQANSAVYSCAYIFSFSTETERSLVFVSQTLM